MPTPREWLERLAPRIVSQQGTVDRWRRYYQGDHDLPTGPSQVSDAFRMFQKKARTNLCGLCVRSMADRMQVIGYRDAQGADEEMWALWAHTQMPARQYTLFRKALALGSAFVVVGPDPRRPDMPRITIEGPDRIAVELDPADPSNRLAGVRLWHDPLIKRWLATVYTPGTAQGGNGRRYYFQTSAEHVSAFSGGTRAEGPSLRLNSTQWVARDGTDEGGERSTVNLPVIPFLNAEEGDEPLAEFAGEGIDIQDRLNLSVLNRLTIERFAAYRQRGLLNYLPDEDPVTGLPIRPFNPGVDQIWTVAPPKPGDPAPSFVDFAQSTTADILRAIEGDMRAFAAATITPVYYLPGGDMVNLSADALVALDTGHTSKVRQRTGLWSSAIADVWSLMAEIAKLEREVSPEMIAWAKPEAFHTAAVADYVSKMAPNVPMPMVLEDIGWSPARIEAFRSEKANEQLLAATLAARGQTATDGARGGTGGTGGTGGAAGGQQPAGRGAAAAPTGTPAPTTGQPTAAPRTAATPDTAPTEDTASPGFTARQGDLDWGLFGG